MKTSCHLLSESYEIYIELYYLSGLVKYFLCHASHHILDSSPILKSKPKCIGMILKLPDRYPGEKRLKSCAYKNLTFFIILPSLFPQFDIR